MQDTQSTEYVTLTVAIDAAYHTAYEYISDPQKGPEWAVHFFRDVRKTDDGFVATVPFGEVSLAYECESATGVIDIIVGDSAPIPTRLVRNGKGLVYLFHLNRGPELRDVDWQQAVSNLGEELDILRDRIEAIDHATQH